jgi:hypothetical protein
MLGGASGNAFSVAAGYFSVFNVLHLSDQLNGVVSPVDVPATTVTVFNDFPPGIRIYISRSSDISALGFLCTENIVNNYFDIVSRDSTGNVVEGDTSVVSWMTIGG